MTTLRIAIDSSGAVRGANEAKDAIRGVGAAAQGAESAVRRFSDVELELGNLRVPKDPFGIEAAAEKAKAAISEVESVRQALPFGAGVTSEIPSTAHVFGAGVFDGPKASSLDAATAAAAKLSAEMGATAAAAAAAGKAAAGIALPGNLVDETRAATKSASDLANTYRRWKEEYQRGGVPGGRSVPPPAPVAAPPLPPLSPTSSGPDFSGIETQLRSILRIGGAIIGIRGIAATVEELISFEQGMVGIKQATGLAGPALDDLHDRIVSFSTNSGLPVATADLLKFAEASGRLQIRSPEGIEKFVSDVAVLRTIAPTLGGSAEDVGNELGTFLRNLGEAPGNVQPLADSIARLDDQFGASADAIFATAQAVAQAGAGFVRSSADALGLGAALASLGVDGGQAATAVGVVMTSIRDALSEGGAKLQTIVQLTGLVPTQLREAFRADAAGLFVTVLEGLQRQGSESASALDDLGLAGARQARIIGPLIENTDQLRRALEESRDAQERGGDAARDASDAQATLAAQLNNTRNIFTAATGASQGLVGGLAQVAEFGNDVAASMLGVAGATENASAGARATADALLIAGSVGLAASGIRRATAAWTEMSKALTIVDSAAGTVGPTLVGVSAAAQRAATGLSAFLASPAGIAVAVAGAVYGLSRLQQKLDEISVAKARAELDQVAERIGALDRAATGLANARELVLTASFDGNDAEARAEALGLRLRELQAAQAAIAGRVLEKNPQAQERLDEVRPRLRAVIEEAVPEGALLDSSAIEQRLNEAIAAAVRGVEIPGVPPEKAEEFRASVTRVFSGVTIPTEQLRALKVDELFPDVQASGEVFRQSLVDAVESARQAADEKMNAAFAALRASAIAGGGQFIPSGGLTPDRGELFSSSFRDSIGEQVSVLFGPDVGARAQAVLTATINGLEIPGIPKEKSEKLSASINAALDVVSGEEVDAPEIGAIEKSLLDLGLTSDEVRLSLSAALLAGGEVNPEGIRILGLLLDAAGANAVSAEDAVAGLAQAAAKTQAELGEIKPNEKGFKLSDFYVDESKRIQSAIRDAELSINRLTTRASVQVDDAAPSRSEDLVLVGIEARREALRQERREYEEMLDLKSSTKTPVKGRITGEEAALLRDQADAYLEVRDAVLLFAEAQRRLQAEENVLQRVQGVLGQQLSILGARAQGETAQAFSIMRQEVELSTLAQLKNIEAMERSGAPSDEVAKYREIAAAQQQLSLAGIKYQEALVKNRRAVDDLSSASSSFAGNATSALLGLQEPAEALRSFLIDIARQFLEPRLQNAFLGLFHDDDKETLDAPSQARAAAEQAGVGDLFRRDQGDGPQLPPAPSPFLQEQAFAPIPPAVAAAELQGPVAPPLEQIGLAAGQATAGLEGVGPAAQGAAGGLDRAGTSSETAATAADRLAGAAERAAIALDRIGGAPQAAAAAVDVQGPVLPDALEAASSDAQELAFGEVQGPRAPLPPLDLSSAFAPPVGAGADADLSGLDALDSGAEDAARAVAGLSEPVQLAAEGLDELSPAVKLASSSVSSLGENGPDRLIDSSVRDQVAQNQLGFGFAHQASNSAAAAGIGGQLPIRGLDLSDTGDTSLADLIGPINQLGPATELATAGMESAAKAGELVAGGMQLVAPAVESTAFSLTPMQQAVIAAVTGFNAATNAVIQFAAAASAAAAKSAVGFSHGGVVGGGEVRAFADGGMPTVSDLSGSVISGPTYALIGEGDDDEAIMPLDARGGVRGVNQRGEPVSLPLGRDKGGKLGVRVDLADARAFSRGGVPGRDHAFALFGDGGVPPSVSPEQALADRSSVVNNSSVDHSRTTTIYSTVNVRGGGGLMNSGMKLTMRQMRAELQNLGRMVQQ